MPVSIVKSDLDNVREKMKYLLELIEYKPKKNKVMLKPNLVGPSAPECAVTTHPLVTAALIEYFQSFNCEVVIAESSSLAQNTMESFERCGYMELAKKYGVELVDLNNVKRVSCKWKYGEIEIPEMAFSYEYVNIPKMKTHTAARVTLGMKNQKGLITHADKRRFHITLGLQNAVRELQHVITPDLTVIDAIIAMEGNGPGKSGIPINMNVLVAGTDLIEVDNIGIQLMGFKPGEVEHIPVKDNIEVVGDSLEALKRNFKRASENMMSFNDNLTYYHMRSCSGCFERFIVGYYHSPDRSKFAFSKPVDIISGKDAKILHEDHITVCYGDCTKKYAEQHSLPFLGGCPPEIADIKKIPDLINEKYAENI